MVKYSPDSVDVYASKEKLDSITLAYTERLNYVNFRDTLLINARLEKIKGVKSVAEAQKKGGKVSDVNQITFSAPVFISETGASEPALSGAVAATAQGKFSAAPVKGNAGVYLFQVKSKNTRTQEYKEGVYEMSLKQKAMQYAGNFMQELFAKANVKDNRYLFF